ncbi:hypothetical protein SporoP37_12145 [Sporosarcina sp. P37]|uniref:hypothetical protein n=1 Tax=unclassified Sporosarcina TaxID=2647733 RepID=UPI000A17D637|nr:MULTISPECIES: hypothetical protein [unclassified Sporosarcina]ARK25333.1 hypothetical protein SporoP37_12145 [Sporosarcina sp. P37]PID16272.1 hypothetical protein CSV62_15720 [Sporosarcina sp. P35]
MKKSTSKLLIAALASSAIIAPISSVASAATPVKEGVYFSATNEFFTVEQLGDLSTQKIGKLFDENSTDQVFIYTEGIGTATLAQANASDFISAANENGFKNEPEKIIPEGSYVGKDGNDIVIGDVVAPELSVESVSAIDETGVTVSFTALTEAKEGATITVVDPSGKTVEVTPVNLEVGDTSATFDFVTAYEELPLGTFVVQGKDFDTAAVDAVVKVNEATNVVELWTALQSKYFTGAVEANIEKYDTLLDGTQTTVAEVQAIIDEVNQADMDAEAEAATVKKVADATNVLQLLNALKDPAFSNVNADWITDYSTENVTLDDDSTTVGLLALDSTYYFGETPGATIEGIQNAIDAQNLTKAGNAVTAAEGTLSQSDITDAKALVNKYVPADAEGVTTKKDLLDRLAVHEAVVNVTVANTNAKLSAALNALDKLSDDFDIATVNSKELTRYRTDITTAVAANKDTAAEIQTIIGDANDDAETAAAEAVRDVTAATTPAQLKELLATLSDRAAFGTDAFDNTTVVEASLQDYIDALVAETTPTNKNTAALIQGIIDGVNSPTDALDAVDLEVKTPSDATGAALLALLQNPSLKLDNLVEANALAYLADVADFDAAITDTNSVAGEEAAVKDVVNATNARVALNAATTDTAAKTALTKFAIATSNTTYINLSSTAKLEVAGLVLAEKPANGYADNADVTSEITTQDTARGTLLTNVNGATTINAMNTALSALDYKAYNDLSASQKVAVAEAFLANFPTDKDGDKVAYSTLTNIKADIDKAITAVAE